VLLGGSANGVIVSASRGATRWKRRPTCWSTTTKPHVVKDHTLLAVEKGRHVVIGTVGTWVPLTTAEIDCRGTREWCRRDRSRQLSRSPPR